MTKKEFITLLREDMAYQLRELTPENETVIKINGIALHTLRTIKLIFQEHYVLICYKQNGIKITIAHLRYEDIHSVGYKYLDTDSLERRLAELRFDSQCCREA